MGFVKNLGSKYLVLFDTDDYDLIFKSKFNLLFNSNNSLIDQYRDSIILKILAKEHHVDVIAKYKLSKKQNKNSNELTNQKIISHFGKYEEEICMDKKFVNLILEIWR
jgi:hypothetical protein